MAAGEFSTSTFQNYIMATTIEEESEKKSKSKKAKMTKEYDLMITL